jgi:predicted transcriptional regulator
MAITQTPPNIRISPQAHRTLQRLARDANKSMQAVLDKAIEAYRREEFLRAANRDYAELRQDAKAWKETLTERHQWEKTSHDGLGRR